MNFNISEKVVCINPIDGLVKHEIYTIKLLHEDAIQVSEHDNSTPDHLIAYYGWRFRKLDYDFVEEVLSMIKEDCLVN